MPDLAAELRPVVESLERMFPNSSVAARIAVLTAQRGDTTGLRDYRDSNGDEVWCVVRSGRAVTVFFRRSTQPHTRETFGVDRVVAVRRGGGTE